MNGNPQSGTEGPTPLADQRHALRARLANLRLYLDLLDSGQPEKRAHYLAVLHAEIDRLAAIVDRLGRSDETP